MIVSKGTMTLNIRHLAVASVALVAAGTLYGVRPALAQGRGNQTYVRRGMTGAQSNPLYNDEGRHGDNPLYEQKLRMIMGGATSLQGSGGSSYSVDIELHVEVWDGAKWLHQEKIIHRDLAARNVLLRTVDVISTPEGVDIQVDRGPRQSISLDGSFPTRRISTNFTVSKQTQQQSFGDRISVQSFGGPDGEPGQVVVVPLD